MPQIITRAVATMFLLAWTHAAAAADDDPFGLIYAHEKSVCDLAFVPNNAADARDGEYLLVSASRDGAIKVWSVSTGLLVKKIEVGAPVVSIVATTKGDRLTAWSRDNKIRVYSLPEGRELSGWEAPVIAALSPSYRPLRFSADETKLLAYDRIWSFPDGKSLDQTRPLKTDSLAFFADEHLVLAWTDEAADSVAEIRSWPSNTSLARVSDNAGELMPHIPKNRAWIALGWDDGESLSFWDVKDGTRLFQLEASDVDPVTGEEFPSPGRAFSEILTTDDGSHLLTGSLMVKIWDVTNRKLIKILRSESYVLALAVSPDKRLLAVGTNHGGIALWDASTFLFRGFVYDPAANKNDAVRFRYRFTPESPLITYTVPQWSPVPTGAKSVRRMRGGQRGPDSRLTDPEIVTSSAPQGWMRIWIVRP